MSAASKSKPSVAGVGSRWTKAEDEALARGIHRDGDDFELISAKYLHGRRTSEQCRVRWEGVLAAGLVKGAWTPEEDSILLDCISSGMVKWSAIASHLPGRIGKQCRERYQNHLAPDLNRGPFTADEDAALMQAVRDIGTRWIEIAKMLPGRSENACKNRYNSTLRRQANALKAIMRKQTPNHDLSKVAVTLAKQTLGIPAGPGSSSVACEDEGEDAEAPDAGDGVQDTPKRRLRKTPRARIRQHNTTQTSSTSAAATHMHAAAMALSPYQAPPVTRSVSCDAPVLLVGGYDEDVEQWDQLEDILSPRSPAAAKVGSESVDGQGPLATATPAPAARFQNYRTPVTESLDHQRQGSAYDRKGLLSSSSRTTPVAELSMLSAISSAQRFLGDSEVDGGREMLPESRVAAARQKRPRPAPPGENLEGPGLDTDSAQSNVRLACRSPADCESSCKRTAALSQAAEIMATRSVPRLRGQYRTPKPVSRQAVVAYGTLSAPTRLSGDLGLAPHLRMEVEPPPSKRARREPRLPDSAQQTSFRFTENGMDSDRESEPSDMDGSPRMVLDSQPGFAEDDGAAPCSPAMAPAAVEALTALKTVCPLDTLSPLHRSSSMASQSELSSFYLPPQRHDVKPNVSLDAIGASSGGAASAPSELDSAEALLTMFCGARKAPDNEAADEPSSIEHNSPSGSPLSVADEAVDSSAISH